VGRLVVRWVDGLLVGWMNDSIDWWMINEWVGGGMCYCMVGWMDELIDGLVSG
jgi:hypothetical protein